jgi:hypothetical protein
VLYIYSTATGSFVPQGTVSPATSASFSADGTTIYIVAGDQEYIYSANTGWTIQPVVAGAVNGTDVAAFTPSVGAFFSGSNTQVVNYCPKQTTPATTSAPGSAVFYYPAASTGIASDELGVSNDGLHLFAATSANSASTPFSFTDACISVSPYTNFATGKCTVPTTAQGADPVSVSPCPITVSTANKNFSTAGILPAGATVTGIPVATSSSTLSGSSSFFTAYTAFLTYNGVTASTNGAVLPYYQIYDAQAAPTGLSSITLTNPGGATPIAPTAAAVSPDNTMLYVTTSGDGMVHFVTIPASLNGAAPSGKPYENVTLNPPQPTQLPGPNNTFVPADAMAVRAIGTN